MRTRASRIGTMLGAAALLASGTATVSTPAAHAEPDHCHVGRQVFNGEGYGVTRGAYHLKQFAYADCTNVASLAYGETVYLWCSLVNDYGHTWYYVREQGADVFGWISADSITVHHGDDDGDGSYEPRTCKNLG